MYIFRIKIINNSKAHIHLIHCNYWYTRASLKEVGLQSMVLKAYSWYCEGVISWGIGSYTVLRLVIWLARPLLRYHSGSLELFKFYLVLTAFPIFFLLLVFWVEWFKIYSLTFYIIKQIKWNENNVDSSKAFNRKQCEE